MQCPEQIPLPWPHSHLFCYGHAKCAFKSYGIQDSTSMQPLRSDTRNGDASGLLLLLQMGLVSQEPTLFATSIGANIAYGKPGATPAEIEAAAISANAHSFIAALPHGCGLWPSSASDQWSSVLNSVSAQDSGITRTGGAASWVSMLRNAVTAVRRGHAPHMSKVWIETKSGPAAGTTPTLERRAFRCPAVRSSALQLRARC